MLYYDRIDFPEGSDVNPIEWAFSGLLTDGWVEGGWQ